MNSNSSTQRVQNALKSQAKKLQGRWRKAITGSPNKRVRDHIREVQEVPKNIKFLDKVGFTLGVLNILACQYFLLNVPQYFSTWYAVILPITLASRFYHFKSLNFHYFLIDFCYFTIFITFLNLYLFRSSSRFFKICFVFATGVLPIAIPVWRNSLIFHDFDKIVSVYIHILPCMLYYVLRWNTHDYNHEGTIVCDSTEFASCDPLYLSDYVYAVGIYCVWQVAYLLKTEVMDKSKFDSNPEIQTSLRWLAKDTKNEFSRAVLKNLRKIGIFGPKEEFNSDSMKTKLVFVGCQLLLTVVSFFPTYVFYHIQLAHLLWIGLIFTISVFNGASFYIEVFSVRYHAQLEKLDEMQKIARDATTMMQQMAADIGNSQQDPIQKHQMHIPKDGSHSPKPKQYGSMSPKPKQMGGNSCELSDDKKLRTENETLLASSESKNYKNSKEDDNFALDDLDLSEDETLRELIEKVASCEYELMGPE
jgi:hypothetical protein